MKTMKKLFCLVLTIVLALALAAPTFAANVTIDSEKNPDATYDAYQLMTLTTQLTCTEQEAEGAHQHDSTCYAYSYKINSKYQNVLMSVTGVLAAETGKTLDQTIMDKLAEMGTNAEGARSLAESLYDAVTTADPKLTADKNLTQGTTANLAQGYWLIVDTTTLADGEVRSLVMLDTAGQEDITITAKDETVSVTKTVTNDGATSNKYATADIGEEVTFTLTSKLPANLAQYDASNYQFKFVDTMDAGLDFVRIESVKVAGTDVTNYTADGFFDDAASSKNGTGTIDLSSYVRANLTTPSLAGADVEVKYVAKINANATVTNGMISENNDVHVVYTNDYHTGVTGQTTVADVDVYSFSVNVIKYTDSNKSGDYDENDTRLPNAEFQLSKVEGVTTYYATATDSNGVYKFNGWTDVQSSATTFKSDVNGEIKIDGLDVGTYSLTETKAPEGYNLLANPISIEIKDNAVTNADEPTVTIPTVYVNNTTGTELPGTGGMGTTIFYTLGGVLVVGAAVLLVTKKRMNNAE